MKDDDKNSFPACNNYIIINDSVVPQWTKLGVWMTRQSLKSLPVLSNCTSHVIQRKLQVWMWWMQKLGIKPNGEVSGFLQQDSVQVWELHPVLLLLPPQNNLTSSLSQCCSPPASTDKTAETSSLPHCSSLLASPCEDYPLAESDPNIWKHVKQSTLSFTFSLWAWHHTSTAISKKWVGTDEIFDFC